MPYQYYIVIVVLGVGNLVLAVIAFFQRSKQIRGNRLHAQQLALAESRNDLAERRLERLDDQLAVLTDIRDAGRRNSVSPASSDTTKPTRRPAATRPRTSAWDR